MLRRDANAVGNTVESHSRVLNLGRRNLESADVYDVIGTTGKMQPAALVNPSAVGCVDDAVAHHARRHLAVANIAAHKRVARASHRAFVGNKEF